MHTARALLDGTQSIQALDIERHAVPLPKRSVQFMLCQWSRRCKYELPHTFCESRQRLFTPACKKVDRGPFLRAAVHSKSTFWRKQRPELLKAAAHLIWARQRSQRSSTVHCKGTVVKARWCLKVSWGIKRLSLQDIKQRSGPRHTHRHSHRHADTHTQTHTDTHRHTNKHTDTHRHTHRHTQTQTDTDRLVHDGDGWTVGTGG